MSNANVSSFYYALLSSMKESNMPVNKGSKAFSVVFLHFGDSFISYITVNVPNTRST